MKTIVVTRREAKVLSLSLATTMPLLRMNAGRPDGGIARVLLEAAESVEKKPDQILGEMLE